MFVEQTTFYVRSLNSCHITVRPSVFCLANWILTTQANCIITPSKVTGWSFLTLATDRMFVKEASIPSNWMLQEYVILPSGVCTNSGTARRKFGNSCKYQCHFELFVLISLNLNFEMTFRFTAQHNWNFHAIEEVLLKILCFWVVVLRSVTFIVQIYVTVQWSYIRNVNGPLKKLDPWLLKMRLLKCCKK